MNICITSVGARARYTPYLDRLEASLKKHCPNIPRLFFRDCWPPGSPTHQENHYAFKAHAMRAVYWAGFDIGIWLDSACEVLQDPAPIIQQIIEKGYYIVHGPEPLGEWISDQALDHFGHSRDYAMTLNLCGGAIVGLNFKSDFGFPFLAEWTALAGNGFFYTSHSKYCPDKMTSLMVSDHDENVIVSRDPRFKGHRSDEACFSMMLDRRGIKPFNVEDHFTIYRNHPTAIIKTGYDAL